MLTSFHLFFQELSNTLLWCFWKHWELNTRFRGKSKQKQTTSLIFNVHAYFYYRVLHNFVIGPFGKWIHSDKSLQPFSFNQRLPTAQAGKSTCHWYQQPNPTRKGSGAPRNVRKRRKLHEECGGALTNEWSQRAYKSKQKQPVKPVKI